MRKNSTLLLILILLLITPSFSLAAPPLQQIYQIIEAHTVDPVNKAELWQKDIHELSAFLNDPYFAYFTPDYFKHYLESHQGYYGGVGTTINLHEGKLLVWAVQPGSPAASVGLRFGDEIIAVDGKNVRGFSAVDLAMLLRGVPGSAVTVTYLRNNISYTVIMIRVILHIPTVKGYIQDGVAIIELSRFSAMTPQEFRVVLKELRLLLPHGLIIDMRNNSGGALSAVLEVAQELMPAGPVVRLRSQQGKETVLLNQNHPAPLPFLLVLVNQETASAAEILAGAVQDSGAGIIVGRRTFGKGTVQSVFQLSDGGGLRLTTARFFTPLGRAIDRIGINPDVEIYAEQAQLNYAINLVKSNARRQMTFTVGRKDVWVYRNIVVADYPPFITSNRSYIPIRLLAESLGYLVDFDEESFTATLSKQDTVLRIPLRGNQMYLNDKAIPLDSPVIIRADRSFLPARAIAEALGSKVYWNHDARQVTIVW